VEFGNWNKFFFFFFAIEDFAEFWAEKYELYLFRLNINTFITCK